MPLYFDNYYNINQNDFRYEYPSVIKIVIFCQKDWNKDGTNPCVFARKIGILTNLIFKVLFTVVLYFVLWCTFYWTSHHQALVESCFKRWVFKFVTAPKLATNLHSEILKVKSKKVHA